MAGLEVTSAEPVGDIMAQMRALCDAEHPKRAVWVSVGTALAGVPVGFVRLHLATGWLFASPELCRRLALDPSEETLGSILGYTEAKAALPAGDLPVVQALDADGWVVQEMLSSWGRVGEARAVAAGHGSVRVVSMAGCLARRARLIGAEVA